jgi:hypothetical protein
VNAVRSPALTFATKFNAAPFRGLLPAASRLGGYTPGNPFDALIVGVYEAERIGNVLRRIDT